VATPFPPDLADVSSVRKRRMTVDAFDYSTVRTWVNYWFHNDVNIGEGIRALLTTRMADSKSITLLEREKIQKIMKEQDFNASNRVKKGTGAKIGQLTGADAMLYGNIVIFGRDDSSSTNKLGALGRQFGIRGADSMKVDKAVVGITLRIVDGENGEVITTAEARGESSRKSVDVGGALGVKGVILGGSTDMKSSNFQQTIIGEATTNAVANIAGILEGKVAQMPVKARDIEGRVATVGNGSGAGVVLNVGGDDNVVRGDRFAILKINGEIKDPATKEVIDVDAVKIGELVVDTVRDKTASGAYGGQPLSSAYVGISGKGYAARLMSK